MKLEVGSLLSDDEHTASDGPYVRVLKARRWLYLVTAVATLHHYRHIHYSAISKISGGLLEVADWIVTNAIHVVLFILTIQFALLCFQLMLSYETILATRLINNKNEAYERERERVKAAQNGVKLTEEAAAQMREHVFVLVNEVQARKEGKQDPLSLVDLDEIASKKTISEIRSDQIARLDGQVAKAESQLRSLLDAVDASRNELEQANAALERAVFKIPERNPAYALAERSIDALRFGPPLVAAVVALWITAFVDRPPERPSAFSVAGAPLTHN